VPLFMAVSTLRVETIDATSFRRRLIQRMGFSTSILRMCQRIAGFHRMASKQARAAEGVITS